MGPVAMAVLLSMLLEPAFLLIQEPAGQEGTAAQSFSCFIYNVNFMNCSWTKGQAAPDDVQYFLYVQDSEKQWGRECPHYVRESGTHVGCHMPDVSSWESEAYFLVNGTSRHAKIQFFDSFLWLRTIGEIELRGDLGNKYHLLSPQPRAAHTLRIRAADTRVQQWSAWSQPVTFDRILGGTFCVPSIFLQLFLEDDVERARSQLIELPGDLGNKYHLLSPQPRAAHTLRIRAADTRVQQWSAWSQPVTFGSQESGGRFVYVYVLVVLGTVIKDKLNDSRQPDQDAWETFAPAAGKGDIEDLLTVEEVAEPMASTSDAATSASP
ncbi:granulocyte-macrophage colony-stimulating factor receptor subunit alpha-like [Pteropus vampyrus]|uniref:Granulocyte-macrophage colony-stimulating factor receptor subunit alpha-like n=1 Tax=Pteropus vampyrus TaxID=132908 RepID=A0A6P3RL06_PTEVA|nr:granulocyte-macrophage colony-stimulating factor receptor subunit alpha-like [Pteropus vampyrus]